MLSLATEKETPSLQEYLNTAEKEEELLVQTYINGLLQEHQQTMQQAINNQQDQKDYIDSWVHEIKVPLAAITLLVQSVEDDIPEKKYYLLENELGKIVQSVVRTQANYFIQKRLQFSIEGEDEAVLTDRKWVIFIFRQLLSNAVKYTPEGGTITVLISKNKQGVYLSLKDSGIGIPTQDQRRIFDKGFTGENGRKSEQHSTGLGLYLAHSLAKKLGHDLTVESTEGQGTTMTLFLPSISYYYEVK